MTLDQYTGILLWIGAVAQTAFVALWATMPWFRTPVTRALMIKSAALAAMFDLMVLGRFWPNYPGRPVVVTVAFTLVVVGVVSQLATVAWSRFRHPHESTPDSFSDRRQAEVH